MGILCYLCNDKLDRNQVHMKFNKSKIFQWKERYFIKKAQMSQIKKYVSLILVSLNEESVHKIS